MVKRKLAALEKVDADLTNLQYKIRRDPSSYEKEFREQYSQYENQREIFLQAPTTTSDSSITSLRELIDFIAHVADCYPALTKDFPGHLAYILEAHHRGIDPELREKIVGSLVLLRRKKILDSSKLLAILFPILVSTESKSLRALLFQKIHSDLRNSNANTTNHKLNRATQKLLYDLVVADRTSVKALWAVKLVRELWKRQIWTDAKSVEIMKEAALADNEKVIVGATRFFLGGDKEQAELDDESSDGEDIDMAKIKHQMAINKKNRKKVRMMDQAMSAVKKKERKKAKPHPLNFSAFHLLYDPQGFAEELFRKHVQDARTKLVLEKKLLVLQLVSRLVGLHKLTILPLYSYYIKYLTPRQTSVTSFLASLAQATHNLVPPDVLEPIVQKIANEFVSEAAASEVASAGLNAIREICVRQPLAMNDTLLQDLVMYRKSKDKGVTMAAKGLLSLYRQVGPDMLRRRDRGREAAIGMRSGEITVRKFGEEATGEIEGLELLEKWKEEEGKQSATNGNAVSGEEEDDDDGWDVEELDSDDSGGWINVASDDEINISDSDDQTPRKRNPSSTQDDNDNDKENLHTEPPPPPPPSSNPPKPNLATTRILTPADLTKLAELRLAASLSSALPSSSRRQLAPSSSTRHADDPLTASQIEGLASLSTKLTKAEKIAHAKADATEHKSTQALRKEKKRAEGKSSTNKEKQRKKNVMMTMGKAKRKGKRSLVEQGRVLRRHVERRKKGGRRGNRDK